MTSDRDEYFTKWARAESEKKRLEKIINVLLWDRLEHRYAIMRAEEDVVKLEEELERVKNDKR